MLREHFAELVASKAIFYTKHKVTGAYRRHYVNNLGVWVREDPAIKGWNP